MSESTIDETKRQLDELERRIKAAKSSVPSDTLAAQAQAQQPALPEGEGKLLVAPALARTAHGDRAT